MIRNPFDNPDSRRTIIGYVMVGSIIVAPFLGLLHAVWLGALVMALALFATSFIAFDYMVQAPVERRPKIRRLALVNVGLAIACLVAAIASYV